MPVVMAYRIWHTNETLATFKTLAERKEGEQEADGRRRENGRVRRTAALRELSDRLFPTIESKNGSGGRRTCSPRHEVTGEGSRSSDDA